MITRKPYSHKKFRINAYVGCEYLFKDLKAFKEDIHNFSEIDLITKAQSGNNWAKQQLLKKNIGYVVSIAKMCCKHYHLVLVDLIAEGVLGVYEAIRRFNVAKEFKFGSYAVWYIKKYILLYIKEELKMRTSALEQLFEDDHNLNYRDVLKPLSPMRYEMEKDIINSDVSTKLPEFCKKLNPTQQKIIDLYFYKELTYEEIGEIIHVSRQRIQQIMFNNIMPTLRKYKIELQEFKESIYT